MCRFPSAALVIVLLATGAWGADDKPPGYWGIGEPASAEQIAGWDIDVRPDGLGLPPGSGSVEDGEMLYDEKCAECHGAFGEGEGRYPALAGGEGSLRDARPHRTVGSYWPFVSTLWDYVHRAMPFRDPQSLTDDEVYAIVAYVLHLNELVDYEFVANQDNLVSVRLPNEGNFIPEQRPDVKAKRCMKNCRDAQGIVVKSEAQVFRPEPAVVAMKTTAGTGGMTVYEQRCAICHKGGVGGAPLLGEAFDWNARLAQGLDTLYKHALEGFQGDKGVMPPKGGFLQLSDAEVKSAVDYMVEQLQ